MVAHRLVGPGSMASVVFRRLPPAAVLGMQRHLLHGTEPFEVKPVFSGSRHAPVRLTEVLRCGHSSRFSKQVVLGTS